MVCVCVADYGDRVFAADCLGMCAGSGCCAMCWDVWRGTSPAAGARKQGSAQTPFNRHVLEELTRQRQPGGKPTLYQMHDPNTRGRWRTRRSGARAKRRQQQLQQQADLLDSSRAQLHKLQVVLQQRWEKLAQVEKDRLFDVAFNSGREGKDVHGRRYRSPGSAQLARIVLLHAGQHVHRQLSRNGAPLPSRFVAWKGLLKVVWGLQQQRIAHMAQSSVGKDIFVSSDEMAVDPKFESRYDRDAGVYVIEGCADVLATTEYGEGVVRTFDGTTLPPLGDSVPQAKQVMCWVAHYPQRGSPAVPVWCQPTDGTLKLPDFINTFHKLELSFCESGMGLGGYGADNNAVQLAF